MTLEPCCHVGKTPPCTEAILAAGVARVVAAMADPFPRVAGGGLALLRDAGLAVEVGLEADAARRLNAPYLKRLATGLPYVTAKWAMTLDGKTAAASGDSRWISGPRSRALVHELRGRMDAILVGIGTALADDPELTARPPGPRRAARVVLDGAARLPLDGRLATDRPRRPRLGGRHRPRPGRPPRGAGGDRLRGARHARLGPGPDRPPARRARPPGRDEPARRGGGRALGSFLDAGQIDAVDVFLAPALEGGEPAFTPAHGAGHPRMADALRLDRSEVSLIDGDVRIRGTFPPSWRLAE